ncbi:TonB-dependent siderophore receptor [Phormidium sp. CLA17]|uniref:TonB-dependent siderophore receptor n=1 Tax=Leptolyngbya sp. Cla-17 TaxID=2803751 RepID=UPI0018D5B7B6|nr:TonB-dependent siderophore receptor [Leptolyngbya sp. Cla-17]MBM0744122.1 TonB-dependent siderophore receptor [Leptolyngbya sp. Cla-17]
MHSTFVKTVSFQLFYITVGLLSAIAASSVHAQSASTPVPSSSLMRLKTGIPRLSDRVRPATTVKEWVAQMQEAENQTSVKVTGVKLEPNESGLDIVLETANGTLQVDASQFTTEGNALVATIANTVLALHAGNEFQADNPTADIATVTVAQVDATRIQVRVVGKAALPTSDVTLRTGEFAYSLNPDAEADEEVVVTGDRPGSRYAVPNAATATRTDTPLRDIPQSIQVIPRQVIEDQQVIELPEAVRNVSGVTRTYGYAGSTDNYTIRGLTSDFKLRNGFREEGFYGYTDPSVIERIEVLKGPASVLYGQFEPGGVVNYITKQPLSEPYYAGQFRVGSFDYYRPSFDLSGPLTPDKKLLYRLNAAYENSGSFRDFVNKELFVVAPVLSFKIGEATNLTLEYERVDLERTFDRGFPPLRESFQLPISRNLGEPSDRYDFTSNKVNLVLDHRFNDNLRIRSAFSTQLFDSLRSNVQARTFLLEPDGRTLRRRFTLFDESTDYYSLQTDLIGKFNTGSVAHQVLFGVDWSKRDSSYLAQRAEFRSIDIFNPVYGFPTPKTFNTVFGNDQTSNSVGIYLQDQVTLLPNLKLLVGGRVDLVDFDSKDFTDDDEPTRSKRSYTAFSPRFGLVYQPIAPISLYASYSRSFKPNAFAFTADGSLIEPERGTQYEVGIKGEAFNGKLSATLAYYDITKTNVATTDPNNIDFSIATGEVTSRGIELDITGEILPGWNVIASFAHNDAYVSKDNSESLGNRLVNAPRQSASLWTTYQLQSGPLQGLGIGAGIYFVGDRDATLPNTVEIPSYVRADATIFYRRDKYRVSLNFQNISNTRYYDSQGFLLYPGAPLSVYGSISFQF